MAKNLENTSVITVYKNAVPRVENSKRDSSSSEEQLDTSDELTDLNVAQMTINQMNKHNDVMQFIAENPIEQQSVIDRGRTRTVPVRYVSDGEWAHCSNAPATTSRLEDQQPPPQISKAGLMIHEAEASRARIFDVKGNDNFPTQVQQVFHSAVLDEEYLLVGNYLDETIKQRIGQGKYIDFAKLMPREKVFSEDDTRMEMINSSGQSFWVLVTDRENTSISNFAKWEQAFRVYSNVYTAFHPARAGELIQYNHIIHTAAQTYSWDNVYRYNREFRMHMSRHHLNRSWAVILQQAWTMFLKDRVSTPGHNFNSGNSHWNGNGARKKLCFDFNSGNCTYGKRCKFDHRCSFCNKYGHGSFCCRKANRNNSTQGRHGHISHKPSSSSGNDDRWEHYEKEHAKVNNHNVNVNAK